MDEVANNKGGQYYTFKLLEKMHKAAKVKTRALSFKENALIAGHPLPLVP